MVRPRLDKMNQREMALALRYHIDQAQLQGVQHRDIVARIVRENPRSFWSSHVQHNLGVYRLQWLAREGLQPDEEVVPA